MNLFGGLSVSLMSPNSQCTKQFLVRKVESIVIAAWVGPSTFRLLFGSLWSVRSVWTGEQREEKRGKWEEEFRRFSRFLVRAAALSVTAEIRSSRWESVTMMNNNIHIHSLRFTLEAPPSVKFVRTGEVAARNTSLMLTHSAFRVRFTLFLLLHSQKS